MPVFTLNPLKLKRTFGATRTSIRATSNNHKLMLDANEGLGRTLDAEGWFLYMPFFGFHGLDRLHSKGDFRGTIDTFPTFTLFKLHRPLAFPILPDNHFWHSSCLCERCERKRLERL
jgi:hypothetical protein